MNNTYLEHHGIKGMKWGVRRFQNKDGSLTAAGRKRAAKQDDISPEEQAKREQRKATAKKIAIGAAVVGGTVLAAYGAYKFNDYIKMESTQIHMKNGEKFGPFGINNPDESFRTAFKNVVDDRAVKIQARQHQRRVERHDAKLDRKVERLRVKNQREVDRLNKPYRKREEKINRDVERRRAKDQRRIDRYNNKVQRDFERRMKPYQKAEERRVRDSAKNAAKGQRELDAFYGPGNVSGKTIKVLPKKRRRF